ncbi:MAG: ABC transporter permease [Candidatus Promineifilaceae bacterium]
MTNKVKQIWEFIFPFVVVLVLWEGVFRFGLVEAKFLPPPSAIMSRVNELIAEGILQHHLRDSFMRLIVGYFLSVVAGIGVGALLAISKIARDTFSPIFSLLLSVPTIAWVPVLLITLGLGNATIITAVFLGGFFAIAFNTMRGVEMVSKSQVNAARLMGVSELGLFPHVYLPASMVATITGLRLGIGYAWRALVGGEMLSALAEWGVGKMIYQARFFNDITAMFVGLMLIGVGSFLIDRILLKQLEKATVEKWGMLAER